MEKEVEETEATTYVDEGFEFTKGDTLGILLDLKAKGVDIKAATYAGLQVDRELARKQIMMQIDDLGLDLRAMGEENLRRTAILKEPSRLTNIQE